MFYKSTKIMIVEPDRRHAFSIEKMLNSMGYYSISQVSSLEEGLMLSQFGGKLFSVLLVPEYMIKPSADIFFPLCGFNVDGLFIYSCSKQTPGVTARLNGTLRSSVGLPKVNDLESFMTRVDGEEASRFLKSAC